MSTTRAVSTSVMVAAGAATAATVIVLSMVWRSGGGSSSSSSSSEAKRGTPNKSGTEKPKSRRIKDEEVDEAKEEDKAKALAHARNILWDDDYLEEEAFELPPHLKREIYKNQRRQSKRSMLAMKTRMYDNIRMLAPDGLVLCTISLKKAKWYVSKGIAEWTKLPACLASAESTSTSTEDSNNTRLDDKNQERKQKDESDDDDDDDDHAKSGTIQLLFEPKNRSSADSSGRLYLQSDKFNQCVCCGSTELYMRHYVVPYAYRTLLPPQYKTHLSHDIVLLCPECHLRAEQSRQVRMTQLEQACLQGRSNSKNVNVRSKVLIRPDLARIRSYAMALARRKDQLPPERIQQYDQAVREYLRKELLRGRDQSREEPPPPDDNNTPLTLAQLQVAMNVEFKVENPNYISGAKLLVQSLGNDPDKMEAFVQEWRRHFLQTMRPRFLPQGWSTTAPVVCGGD